MLWYPRKQFRYPPGMESCLKKPVLEAGATGFQDPWKGGWEPMGPSGRKNGARRARLEANQYILATGGGPKANSGLIDDCGR